MTPIDQEIMFPNSVMRKRKATRPTRNPPVRPVMSDTASMSPVSVLILSVGTAAPMPNAEKR